ncbi:uncharacterized protein LOC8033305 [Ixodes scapularis]|uniref:uncharacterized protein LOC8033305 n=1 Tax=Ixodes scapularis TaxID=6945 RepID=UPI001A9D28C7|nr:uncharacterized protein LOC8033305 [Ixodes scapularis]
MISAMPAVAVRRERRRSKTGRTLSAGSRQGSVNSLSQRPASLSTLSSLPGHRLVRTTLQEQRSRLLMYLGTLLLVTGLVLLFIGVGANVSYTQTVGLIFIATGGVLYFIKVFITPDNTHTIVRRARLVGSRDSLYSVAPVGIKTHQPTLPEEGPQDVEQDAAGEDATQDALQDASQDALQAKTASNNSPTPTSLNGGAPETQVLIPGEDQGRF